MIEEYSKYSGDSIGLIKSKFELKLNKEDINSRDLILLFLKNQFNIDGNEMVSKYHLFSPQMLPIIINSNYKSLLDHKNGVGLLSEFIKLMNPEIEIDFIGMNPEISNFSKWRFSEHSVDVNVINDFNKNYDVIISDGYINYLIVEDQIDIINNYSTYLNPSGLLCLLIDMSGKSIENQMMEDVDICELHSILELSKMICIFGKNTFSSLWKKMN